MNLAGREFKPTKNLPPLASRKVRRRMYIEHLTLEDFDPNKEWARDELDHFGTLMMKEAQPLTEDPVVLDYNRYRERVKREIYLSSGNMDNIVSPGMYWRTHPNGRRVNSDEQKKKNGTSYYV